MHPDFKDGKRCGEEAIGEVAEAVWSVQPGEEGTEGRPHCSYNFLGRRRGGSGTDLLSVTNSDRT